MKPRGGRGGLRFHLSGITAISAPSARSGQKVLEQAQSPKHRDGTVLTGQFLPMERATYYVY